MNGYDRYHRYVKKVLRKLDLLGGLSLTGMMCVIAINVILRKLDITFGGASEYVQFLMAMCIGFSIADCAARNGHVEITMFVDKLPSIPRKFFELFSCLLTLIFVAAASYFLIIYGIGYIKSGTVGMVSKVPFYPFAWVCSLGFLLYALVAIDEILRIFLIKEEQL